MMSCLVNIMYKSRHTSGKIKQSVKITKNKMSRSEITKYILWEGNTLNNFKNFKKLFFYQFWLREQKCKCYFSLYNVKCIWNIFRNFIKFSDCLK